MKGSLFSRLLATHVIVALGALAILGVVADRLLERRLVRDLESRLVAEARAVHVTLVRDGADLQELTRSLGAASGSRITVVGPDGVVLADSESDPATMENHAARPEVRTALQGRVGTVQRVSDTTHQPYLYVAIPPERGLVVRTALPAAVIAEQRGDVRRSVALSFAVVALVAAGLAMLAAGSVSKPLARLAGNVSRLGSGSSATMDESGPAEVRKVARALNAMAGEIAATMDDLRGETGLREQILSSMSEGVVLVEPSGAVAYANPTAERLLGPSLPPHSLEPGSHEFAVHHPERRELRAVTVRLGDGRTLVVVQDVTAARRIEAMRRDFVADASHELKTPVASILATAETLETAVHEDPESIEGFTASLVAESRRLARLAADLLDLARLEQAGSPSDGPVALSETVERELEQIVPLAEGKGLELQTAVEPGIAVRGSEQDLALAVRNLLDNALRYTEVGEVRVRLARTEAGAILEVADTGAGIPAADLPRIFERFYRVDKARSRATGGTGLGLSIVRHVVQRHGGEVGAESEVGAGSVFRVTLPVR